MSTATDPRRFQIVGRPFFHYGDVQDFSSDFEEGEIVLADGLRDEDGDLPVRAESGFERRDYIAPECLVEIDRFGYAIDSEAAVLTVDEQEVDAALAPLAIVILGGFL